MAKSKIQELNIHHSMPFVRKETEWSLQPSTCCFTNGIVVQNRYANPYYHFVTIPMYGVKCNHAVIVMPRRPVLCMRAIQQPKAVGPPRFPAMLTWSPLWMSSSWAEHSLRSSHLTECFWPSISSKLASFTPCKTCKYSNNWYLDIREYSGRNSKMTFQLLALGGVYL